MKFFFSTESLFSKVHLSAFDIVMPEVSLCVQVMKNNRVADATTWRVWSWMFDPVRTINDHVCQLDWSLLDVFAQWHYFKNLTRWAKHLQESGIFHNTFFRVKFEHFSRTFKVSFQLNCDKIMHMKNGKKGSLFPLIKDFFNTNLLKCMFCERKHL